MNLPRALQCLSSLYMEEGENKALTSFRIQNIKKREGTYTPQEVTKNTRLSKLGFHQTNGKKKLTKYPPKTTKPNCSLTWQDCKKKTEIPLYVMNH